MAQIEILKVLYAGYNKNKWIYYSINDIADMLKERGFTCNNNLSQQLKKLNDSGIIMLKHKINIRSIIKVRKLYKISWFTKNMVERMIAREIKTTI